MAQHIDTYDPKYRQAAAPVLLRHDNFQPEANISAAAITAAIRYRRTG